MGMEILKSTLTNAAKRAAFIEFVLFYIVNYKSTYFYILLLKARFLGTFYLHYLLILAVNLINCHFIYNYAYFIFLIVNVT